MGNLYTRIEPQHSEKIEILYKLKVAYGTYPRNYKEINKLKQLLNKINKPKINTYKRIKSTFNGFYSR